MNLFKKGKLALLAGAMAMAVSGAFGSFASAADVTINMAGPDWPPTRIMQELANKHYKAPSGNNVTISLDFIPWPNYYEKLAASLTSGEEKYQMAVSDSQWLGTFIEGGYFMKLNDIIDADPELQAIFKDLHPNLVNAYSTYPHKSDNFYGFPQMPDVLVNYYRKDIFCDAGEQAASKAKFGYKLPCTPTEMNDTDWDQVRDYGEFFRRSAGETLAGDRIQMLRKRIEEQDLLSGNGTHHYESVIEAYAARITGDITLRRTLKVVLDCGNGVGGSIAPRLLQEIGCDVTELFSEVDGTFPNHHPDPSQLENLNDLIETVIATNAEFGMALGGDGDRLGVVSGTGDIVFADRQLLLLARDVLSRNPGAEIIYDVKCSRVLPDAIREAGGLPTMWKTGHSFIKAKLKESGAIPVSYTHLTLPTSDLV